MISVIMGIYNCSQTLPDAIESILEQTYTDWELIMCDDGSSDDTYKIAMKYQEKYPDKIKLIKNTENKGLNHTLNRCLKIAQGKYIARMDGDDLCDTRRFELELDAFEDGISIVSTDMEFFDETGKWGLISHPDYPSKHDFLAGSPFCHAPCMVLKEAYDAVNGYTEDDKILRVEDYHLWMKMYKAGFRGKNIHIPLYQMRDDRNAYNRRKMKYRVNEAYIKLLIIREFKLPIVSYIYVLRPILVGILPKFIYNMLHKMRLKNLMETT